MLRVIYIGLLCCTLVTVIAGFQSRASGFCKKCDDKFFKGGLDQAFKCEEDDTMCIPKRKTCDSVVDCEDGSDEKDCEEEHRVGCIRDYDGKWIEGTPLRSFTCDDGMCIDECLRCDNVEDCPDGSDEKESDCRDAVTIEMLNVIEYQCQRKEPLVRSIYNPEL